MRLTFVILVAVMLSTGIACSGSAGDSDAGGATTLTSASPTTTARDDQVDTSGCLEGSSQAGCDDVLAALESQLTELEDQFALMFFEAPDDPIPGLEDQAIELRSAAETAAASWRQYREEQCDAVAVSYGAGSGVGFARIQCMIELTEQRVSFLEGEVDQ